MKYKGFVFDLDGTLINSVSDICDSVNLLRKKLKLEPLRDVKIVSFIGLGVSHLLEKCLADLGTGPSMDELVEMYRQIYEKQPQAAKPYQGVLEGLKRLVHENTVVLGVCTNRGTESAISLVKTHFPDICFSTIRGSDSVLHPKPDPSHLLETLSDMGVLAEEACYIGDHEIDMHTARGARVDFFAATYGFGGVKTGSSVDVESFSEFVEKVL